MPFKQDIVTAWDERTKDIGQRTDETFLTNHNQRPLPLPRLSPDVSSHPLDLGLGSSGHVLRPPGPEPAVLLREEPQPVGHLPRLPHVGFQTTHCEEWILLKMLWSMLWLSEYWLTLWELALFEHYLMQSHSKFLSALAGLEWFVRNQWRILPTQILTLSPDNTSSGQLPVVCSWPMRG